MSLRLILASFSGRLGTPARYMATLPRRSRFERGAVASAAMGMFSLVDPHRLTPVQRTAHRIVSGVLAGAVGADLAREDPMIDPLTDGVLLGGAALAFGSPAEELDAWAASHLERCGVPHARWLFAGLAAATTALSYAVAPHRERDGDQWFAVAGAFEEERRTELGADARTLIELLLTAPEGADALPGADALRAQLVDAHRVITDYPTSDVHLVVPHPERLAVPHEQVWPVRGSFVREGIEFGLVLRIEAGRLSMLEVTIPEEPRLIDPALAVLAHDPSLPEVGEVSVVRESDVVAATV